MPQCKQCTFCKIWFPMIFWVIFFDTKRLLRGYLISFTLRSDNEGRASNVNGLSVRADAALCHRQLQTGVVTKGSGVWAHRCTAIWSHLRHHQVCLLDILGFIILEKISAIFTFKGHPTPTHRHRHLPTWPSDMPFQSVLWLKVAQQLLSKALQTPTIPTFMRWIEQKPWSILSLRDYTFCISQKPCNQLVRKMEAGAVHEAVFQCHWPTSP